LEQPCATIAELAELRRRIDVPIAADESIRKADDPLRVVRAGAADIAVLKVAPLGGAYRLLEIATAIDIPIVVSSALDTAVGIGRGRDRTARTRRRASARRAGATGPATGAGTRRTAGPPAVVDGPHPGMLRTARNVAISACVRPLSERQHAEIAPEGGRASARRRGGTPPARSNRVAGQPVSRSPRR